MSKKGFVVSAFLGVMLIMMSFSAVPGCLRSHNTHL